jgi:sugar-specific transcriptional regulator TrmB
MLLKIGSGSVAQIARELSLPRQTVYSILTEFSKRQLVDMSNKGSVKQFSSNINLLLSYIERKKDELERTKDELETALPLYFKKIKHKESPSVIYYEGEAGLKHLFENIIQQYKNNTAHEFRGYGVNFIKPILSDDFLSEFVKKRHSLGVTTRLLIGKGENDFNITNPENTYGRTIKKLPIEPQDSAVYMVGKRIYMFSYKDEVGIMIENESMSRLLKSVFDAQWENTKYKSE